MRYFTPKLELVPDILESLQASPNKKQLRIIKLIMNSFNFPQTSTNINTKNFEFTLLERKS